LNAVMQHSSRGRVPSNYSSNVGGESYMRRGDWQSNSPQTITFHGKRSTKRLVIGVFLIAIILLIAAIIIIILFLTGGSDFYGKRTLYHGHNHSGITTSGISAFTVDSNYSDSNSTSSCRHTELHVCGNFSLTTTSKSSLRHENLRSLPFSVHYDSVSSDRNSCSFFTAILQSICCIERHTEQRSRLTRKLPIRTTISSSS
uniref:SEA domain-containing protein n=1 Tax=Haemonchus contortus TaxID=6289 RepID=A0A7I5EDK9_HAECO